MTAAARKNSRGINNTLQRDVLFLKYDFPKRDKAEISHINTTSSSLGTKVTGKIHNKDDLHKYWLKLCNGAYRKKDGSTIKNATSFICKKLNARRW